MIKPTIGRVVWFYPNRQPEDPEPEQAYAALVTYVWSDRTINIAYFDHNGNPSKATTIALLQDDDPTLPGGWYCRWMPYQIGQAKKHEEPA